MIIISILYYTNTRSWIYILLGFA